MFCPFLKDECNSECVFNNGCGVNEKDPSNCNLYEASNAIISLGFDERTMESYLESIEENSGKDQTESFDINSKLRTIENIVEEINGKL